VGRSVDAPSTSSVGPREKLREWRGYLANHRRRGETDLRGYLADIDEYAALLEAHCGRGLAGAEVLEIGFGTRASRLAVLSAAGASAIGVDMEVPLLELKPSTLRRIQRRNGTERLAKSLARYALFDLTARRRLREALARKYGRPDLEYGRLEVCDARDLELPDASLDLAISEDVFEHMTADSIAGTLAKLHRWLKPGAIALIRPNVFTGISGGHLAEWNVESVRDHPAPRRGAPWEHLRERRYAPNTFLNELTRADYRRCFAAAGFEILEDRSRYPELGATLLTPQLRAELSRWPDEELFSNQTLFALRPS
jgi:ubiquinone/menaquinone biosynthesis C-methylase UbiE